MTTPGDRSNAGERPDGPQPPVISLPKGGGAIRGIGEKFAANPVTGTGSLTVPLATSPGRAGFGPSLELRYDSGAGNGPFGFGFGLSLPAISRKTDKGLPRYLDEPADTFLLSGAEDLVPLPEGPDRRRHAGRDHLVQAYRPRIEGPFARIERWTDQDSAETHWRSITADNITSVYGGTPASRIVDPGDPARVFSWLICETYDDTGNVMVYEYKAENDAGVDVGSTHEAHRSAATRSANRYLKRVRYGNRTSRLLEPDLSRTGWLFQVVFDYGEHDPAAPSPVEVRPWDCRPDSFSSYRAGFEVRTHRRCRRTLMFHDFPDEAGVGPDCLVRSTDLSYHDSPVASFVESVTQHGFRRLPEGGYLRRSLPPLEFAFTRAAIADEVHTLDAESGTNLPYGVDGDVYRWVDLDGDGLSGVLTEQGDAWFYKANLGDGRFAGTRLVSAAPAASLRGAGRQLLDLDGDGLVELVDLAGSTSGFYQRTDGAGWDGFRPFRCRPDIATDDANLRFIDLTGDGHADILISGDDVFTWYPSLAQDGFGPARRSHPDHGPRLVFADPEQAVYLADMSGDGLTDLVRIRNGEVSYWPSLGYATFGARVVMDNAPWFDEPDQFDQRRIRVADIDGSGATDIVYLHRDATRIYLNQSGNGWSPPQELTRSFPRADSLARVSLVDLFGNGTACLVWSSSAPGDAGRQLRYLDLMGGQKPHLLTEVRNNLGAETLIRYASSTRFFLADHAGGRPWITRLPFPVHVVESVRTVDRISGNRFVTRYAYHHGYFDGVEREFRGFGAVEQWDTESFGAFGAGGDAANLDPGTHVPPVLTRTWYHTGAHRDRQRISRQYTHEYYRAPADPGAGDLLLPDTVLPSGLSLDEERQACRALKGSVLRQEVYALDGTEAQDRPYTVSERNYTVELLQAARSGPAVFLVHPRETLTANYERALYDVGGHRVADPRVRHDVVVEVDQYGNVLRSLSIGRGRRHADPDPVLGEQDRRLQGRTQATLTESRFTNAVETPDTHRVPQPAETKVFELVGPLAETFDALVSGIDAGWEQVPYGGWDVAGSQRRTPARRLIEHTRIRYRRDDLTGPLPLGAVEPLALPFETYRLALTPDLLNELYGDRVDDAMMRAAGYQHESDEGWWVPSGQVFYALDEVGADIELVRAQRHFFRPSRFRTPFGADTTLSYDDYDLLPLEMRDAVGNVVTTGERAADGSLRAHGNNYRVLQAELLTDANGNRAAVVFDALGMVVGTAVRGSPDEDLGDDLAGFDPDPDEHVIAEYLTDPLADPHRLLHNAGTRVVYDLSAYWRTRRNRQPRPAVAATLTGSTHVADAEAGPRTVQHALSYSDGFGREVQKKIQAEPGPAPDTGVQPGPRWIGTGWVIFNNKGKPVLHYEPFFTGDPGFERARTAGVSAVLGYDPLQRVVATLHSDDTWEKVTFDPWQEVTWDPADTVLLDPRTDPDVRGPLGGYLAAGDGGWRTWYAHRIDGSLGGLERQAARQAARAAATPARSWADALGRKIVTAVHNRLTTDGVELDQTYANRVRYDIEGSQREIRDARGRTVMRYGYDMLADVVHQAGMDSGTRWILKDVGGSPVLTWDSRGHRIRNEYDPLRRPVTQWVSTGDGLEVLRELTVYGERHPSAGEFNLRGKPLYQFDGAGATRHGAYDFKGNLLSSSRRLTRDYRDAVDWAATGVPVDGPSDLCLLDVDVVERHLDAVLEQVVYTGLTTYDGHNRPTTLTAPDGSEFRLTYNEANLLERLDLRRAGAERSDPYVTNIDYNARGQRTAIAFGSGVRTEYSHDPRSFRLNHLRSVSGRTTLQDLRYVYDAVGNVTAVVDGSRPVAFFDNAVVPDTARYGYDALYQLVFAEGREHAGIAGPRPDGDHESLPMVHPHDAQAMRRYQESYEYDAVGNLLSVVHGSTGGSWSRRYRYELPSRLEPDRRNNQLSAITVGQTEESFDYDAHGNVISMAGSMGLRWDPDDQLAAVDLIGGDRAYYAYDTAGRRVRKVIERPDGTRRKETVYVGGYEVYRRYRADGIEIALERQTLQVLDDQKRIALVETTTIDAAAPGPPAPPVIRYQLTDHLGSVAIEVDQRGRVISVEEYYPFGETSVRSGPGAAQASRKRYRFNGKERDEQTGLYYYGARYYASRLGRWISSDPAGLVDGSNTYRYVKNNPVNAVDPAGKWSMPSWRTIAVVAAVVVVGTVVTVATAGAAGPLVVGAVASIGLTGGAATVATGVVVGAVAGAAGGAIGGAAGELTRQTVNSRALSLGKEEFSAGKVGGAAWEGGVSGAKWGAAIGGGAALASTAAGTAVIGAAGKLAQRAAPQLSTQVASAARAVGAGVGKVAEGVGLKALSQAAERVGLRAAQGVFAEGSVGGQAVQRLAQAGGGAKAPQAPPVEEQAVPPTSRPQKIVDANVLVQASKGNANALTALRSGDPKVTFSQLREFLDVSTEVQQTQRAQFLLQEGVTPLSPSVAQLSTPELSNTFWRIARAGSAADTTADAALVIHGLETKLPIVTGDGRLVRFVEETMRLPGVTFELVNW